MILSIECQLTNNKYIKGYQTTMQGSKGIQQWPKNLYTSPMMTYKITPSVYCNWWLKNLDTQVNELTNQNSIKSSKLLGQQIRKHYYKTLGTIVINILMSPPSLLNTTILSEWAMLLHILEQICKSWLNIPAYLYLQILRTYSCWYVFKDVCYVVSY